MSSLDGNEVSLFPYSNVRAAVEQYTLSTGKAPKLLVANEDDYLDWKLSMTLIHATKLHDIAPELKVTCSKRLAPGEIDLAQGIE